MSERVTVRIDGHIADVRCNRPERHNALDAEQFRAVYAAGAALASRQDVRVVVLSGEGPSFCSGIDFRSFQQPGRSIHQAFEVDGGGPANFAQRTAHVWRTLPMPVLAALHGVAYGGGLQIALAADLRIVSPTARLSLMEIEYGLIPDMAITQTLPPLVGLETAKDLAYTGRIVDGHEAVRLGLAGRTAEDPRAAALALARDIAARSPDAIRGIKALFDASWPHDPAGLEREARLQQEILARPNQREAVTAKFENRPPRFED